MEEHKAKKAFWTRMEDWKSTKVEKVRFDLDYNRNNVQLACLVDMLEVLKVFLD